VSEGPAQSVLVLGAERATVVQPGAFSSADAAAGWLDQLRADKERLDAELEDALAVLNRAMRAWRAAKADPYATELSLERARRVRVGYGGGQAVADGRLVEAFEVERPKPRRAKRSMEAPDERFAALLGARERQLVAEELVLRARADLNAERPREAALQARVALEALIAELGALAGLRETVGAAANAALTGDIDASDAQALTEAIEVMEAELRRHRLGG
jgi:hypothetical protein